MRWCWPHGLVRTRALTGGRARADRYFGSFPKVGIVIPNPSVTVLPELQDLTARLATTLLLPPNGQLPNGLSLQPDSDGFLIFLPSGARPCPAAHIWSTHARASMHSHTAVESQPIRMLF